jgi:hypothetical protein
MHGQGFDFHFRFLLLAEGTDSTVIVDLVSCGTGFQPVNHRQDADATLGFDARRFRDQIESLFRVL